MKILCLANDIPLPANSGGRVDVWRRLTALRAAGHSLALVCWIDAGRVPPPTEQQMAQLLAVCDSVKIMAITRSLAEVALRALQLWRWPSHVASRVITAQGQGIEAWARDFSPDLILLDGLYPGAVAVSLAKTLGRPMWYRSHNIEHRYMADQRQRETRWIRRLGLAANCMGLARFERSIIRRAQRVLDISEVDAAYWQAQGFSHVVCVPTLVDAQFAEQLANASPVKNLDFLYFGNLNTPNNVEAVQWWVKQVLPRIQDPGLRIAVAGSKPSPQMRDCLALDSRIRLIENPEIMAEVIADAHVLVNPMLAGSGVNLKSVEMLFTDAALVSTSVGVQGLPQAAKACFTLADSPENFAAAMQDALAQHTLKDQRASVRSVFSPSNFVGYFNPAKGI